MPPENFHIEVARPAQKEILHLHPKIRRQVEATIDRLLRSLNAGQRPQDVVHLEGEPNGYRIDSGEYRILFYLFEAEARVDVIRVRHRKDVYRNL